MVLLIDAAAVRVHHEGEVLRGTAEGETTSSSQLLTGNDVIPLWVLIMHAQTTT